MATTEELQAEFQKSCEVGLERMAKLKAVLKERKIKNTDIAFWCGCSPSNISRILNGNWPMYQCGGAPVYFEKWVSYWVKDENGWLCPNCHGVMYENADRTRGCGRCEEEWARSGVTFPSDKK